MFDFYAGQDESPEAKAITEGEELAVYEDPASDEAVSEGEVTVGNENEGSVSFTSDRDKKKKDKELLEEEAYDKHNKYAVLSVKNYFWSMFVMAIPVLGWLVALVWAVGLCRNRNRRNLARAFVIWIFIGLVVAVIAYFAAKWFLFPKLSQIIDSDSFRLFIERLKTI